MPRLPTDGGDTGAWGDLMNRFLQVLHAGDGFVNRGTAGAPGLAFSDGVSPDSSTGIYQPGSGSVGISAAGAERYRVVGGQGMYDVAGGTTSLAAVVVASAFTGHANIRNIATINSGTSVVSVQATGIVSGNVILTQVYMYGSALNSGQNIVTNVQSVRAGAFEITTGGSIAPAANMPVAWFVMR